MRWAVWSHRLKKHSILVGEECIQGCTQGRKAFIGQQTDSSSGCSVILMNGVGLLCLLCASDALCGHWCVVRHTLLRI